MQPIGLCWPLPCVPVMLRIVPVMLRIVPAVDVYSYLSVQYSVKPQTLAAVRLLVR